MKVSLIIIIVILAISATESRHTSWFPSIFDSLSNRTSQITNYVKEKGRSLKHYYIENVRNRITSYFGIGNTTLTEETPGEREFRMKKRFEAVVTEAQAQERSIFDTIAPGPVEYNCIEDDPTIHLSTPQLIALHGYHSESHTIVTEDGYILTVHRIPQPRNGTILNSRRTVLLHHGLLGSSADWVIPGPGKGLAYILSEAGYDVWLANVRGNTYSRAHVSKHVDTFDFWNFTFHEVSQHDLPAVIDYIMEIKGWDAKIDYIGHSMGTTVLFALLSTKTQYNKVLRAGYALAPVAYMSDIKSPIKMLARFSNNLEFLLKLLGANEFLPQNAVLRWLSSHACEINHYEEVLCENSMFVLCGHDEKQFNKTLLPMILGHVPAGASTKTLVHYAQEIKRAGAFQQFDYGPEKNLIHYGKVTPPEYPVHRITLPIALLSAENDWLSSDVDVTNLFVQLANPIEHYIVPLKEFNHIDFLYAIDAPTLVYRKLLHLLQEGIISSTFTDEYNVIDVDGNR